MDIPASKVVKQKDGVSIPGLGNLSAKTAGTPQGYLEEGGRGFSLPVKAHDFSLLVSLCVHFL